MNCCQHEKYREVRVCDSCGLRWVKHDGELRFAEGVVFYGAAVFALLTPRDERTPAMWMVLGISSRACNKVVQQ